ncbi:ATP-binding protein [Notoacmeibacter sp. MSK16QG-6]|uniref:ATP-binding protein n=1 Tax=Notoacmeibacter sp. MSK16QG-6 TaxID=2957982 RepID=UPI00209EAB47|nr:ATP-binding protein [Notoacmeibacter sp. MSK16QG-6]MCP1199625.1 ATP-binding protein [Notoacmeibacter sp. MSK16QG-6]
MAVRSGYAVRRKFRYLTRALIAAVLIIGTALVLTLQHFARDSAIADLRRQASETLALQSSALTGHLDKFRLLPPLLAGRDTIQTIFAENDSRSGITEAKRAAGLSGAKDVLFLRPDGSVFASAHGEFDGHEFGGGELLRTAMQNRLGRQTFSGSLGQPLYAFASAIRRDDAFLGAIVVLVGLDQLENIWALSHEPILVTWRDVILIGNRPLWKGAQLHSHADAPGLLVAEGGTRGLVRLRSEPEDDATKLAYLAELDLPLLDWRLHALVDATPLSRTVDLALTTGLLLTVLAGLTGLTLLKRSEIAALRLRNERAQALRLERRVRDRTVELRSVNQSLEQEVEVRQLAEKQLRKTQSELIHTAKLAVLGQMSATLSHEYNQPIAAVRSQAENARTFLSRSKPERADISLSHIIRLTERMGDLSKSLLGFARRPGSDIAPTSLSAALDEALMLTGPRLRKAGISLNSEDVGKDIRVMGGRLRLTQVLVNLINNAADALEGLGVEPGTGRPETDTPRISISATRSDDFCLIRIEDNGPGLPDRPASEIFEPFVSTKGVGEGLGIGLSVVDSIVTDFGGGISAGSSAMGGACFEIRLLPAEASEPPKALADHATA